MRVQLNWIYGEFHWVKEDMSRYCYSFSKFNEPVGFHVEWLAKQHEATSWRAPTVATVVLAKEIIPMCDKDKRNIVNRGGEKLQVPSRSISIESNYGYRGKEEPARHANCTKVEG